MFAPFLSQAEHARVAKLTAAPVYFE